MKNYIISSVITQLSMLILIFLVIKNKTSAKSVKVRIIITSVMIMVCDICEFASILLSGTERSAQTAVKLTELLLTPVIPFVLSTAVYPRIPKKVIFYSAAVNAIFQILSLPFGTVFYIDGQNNYCRGSLYRIYCLFILSGVILLVCTAVKSGIRFQNRNNVSLGMILFFAFTGVLIQKIDGSLRTAWLTAAIGMILFYIYYCNMVLQIDAVTELLNRRSYESRFQNQRRRATVLLFDINDFKSINDNHGHGAGDSCLRAVADALKAVYGRYGLCYRIGGDEFCVIIDRHTGSADIDKLNEAFKQRLLACGKSDGNIPTVAVGYSVFKPHKMSFSDAVLSADKQMYRNKNSR